MEENQKSSPVEENQKSSPPVSPPGTHLKFLLSNLEADYITGAKLNKIKSESGALIQLSPEAEYFTDTYDRIIIVSGAVEDILKAFRLILSKKLEVEEKISWDAADPGWQFNIRLAVPGTTTIRSLIEDSGADFKISPLKTSYPWLKDVLVTGTGTVAMHMRAIELILQKLIMDPHYQQSLKTPSPDTEGSARQMKSHLRLLLSNAEAEYILSKRGACYEPTNLLSETHIRLSCNNEYFPGTSHRIIMVSGLVEDILKAAEHIQSRLLEKFSAAVDGAEIRLVIPNSSVGGIIGKDTHIRSLTEACGTDIKVSRQDMHTPGLHDCFITLAGSLAKSKVIIGLIVQKLIRDPYYEQSPETPFPYAGHSTSKGIEVSVEDLEVPESEDFVYEDSIYGDTFRPSQQVRTFYSTTNQGMVCFSRSDVDDLAPRANRETRLRDLVTKKEYAVKFTPTQDGMGYKIGGTGWEEYVQSVAADNPSTQYRIRKTGFGADSETTVTLAASVDRSVPDGAYCLNVPGSSGSSEAE